MLIREMCSRGKRLPIIGVIVVAEESARKLGGKRCKSVSWSEPLSWSRWNLQ
jgi:hypothetical protein